MTLEQIAELRRLYKEYREAPGTDFDSCINLRGRVFPGLLPDLLTAAEENCQLRWSAPRLAAWINIFSEANIAKMQLARVLADENAELKESLMAEGLKDAKAFMRSETVKAMNRELARLKTDLATKDKWEKRLREALEKLVAAVDACWVNLMPSNANNALYEATKAAKQTLKEA